MTKFIVVAAFAAFLLSAEAQRDVNAIKVNVGGPELREIGFLEDEPYFYEESSGIPQAFEDVNAPVVPINWGEVYRTHRYSEGGALTYRFPVPEGTFSLGLMFVEQFPDAAVPGGRLFDLYVNNELLEEGIDVWFSAGQKLYEPFFLQKPGITPVDGFITISLTPVVENPMLSGIVIEGPNAASLLWQTSAPSEATGALPATEGGIPVLPTGTTDLPTPTPLAAEPAELGPAVTPPVVPAVTPPVIPAETPAVTPAATSDTGSASWANVVYTSGVPVARHEACAVFAEGLVFNIGGRGRKPVSVYDPMLGEWSQRPGPPAEINHMQCLYYQGKIYIGSSWYGEFPFESEHEEMWVYDVRSDTWTTLPGPPEGRRRGGAAFVEYQGKFYLSHGAIGGHGPHATVTGYLDVYDPATNTWTALPDGPLPRDHTGGAVVNGKLCVGGGRDGSQADFFSANVPQVVCYVFATQQWQVRASLPVPRGGPMVGATCQGLVMIAGGEGKNPESPGGQAYDRVDYYDDNTNAFLPPSYMTSRRHGSGLAITSCSCGNVYVPSGSAGLGGGPEVTTMDVWYPDGVSRTCI